MISSRSDRLLPYAELRAGLRNPGSLECALRTLMLSLLAATADLEHIIGFAITGFLAMFLNTILSEEIEDEAPLITANEADAADDQAEWARIQHGKSAASDSDNGEKSKDMEADGGKV